MKKTEFNTVKRKSTKQKMSNAIEQALSLNWKQYGKNFLSRFVLHRDKECIQATSRLIAF